jgi:hypothetical protein
MVARGASIRPALSLRRHDTVMDAPRGKVKDKKRGKLDKVLL